MRKLVLLCFFTAFCFSARGQYVERGFFKAGFHAATAIGDASDFSNLGIGLDLYQHWGVSKTIDLGLTTGVQYFFGLESTEDIGPTVVTIEGEDTGYLPAAGFFRFYPTKSINLGADIGYAFGLTDFTQAGFYYRPTLSFDLSPGSALNFSYVGVQGETRTWNTLTGGVVFRF